VRESALKRNAILAAVAAACICAVVANAQSPAPPPQQNAIAPTPTPVQSAPLRVSTKLITISAIVRDKHGAPIADLTKDDFTILDGKTQRPIGIFAVTQTSVAAADPQQLPPDTYSNNLGAREDSPSNLTIILLDALNTPSFDRQFPRGQIKKLLLTLEPTDHIALYALGSRLRVLHEFSSDASTLLDALNKNEDVELLDVDTPPSPGNTNTHNMQLIPLAEENAAVQIAQQSGNRAMLTGDALRTIAEHVSYLPGRKSLIWISDAFPLDLEFSSLSQGSDGKKLANTSENELVIRALEQAHIAIYPIDAHGLEASSDSLELDADPDAENAKRTSDLEHKSSMETIARRTGGRAFTDTNGIMKSVRETIDSSRVTYELGFYPNDVEWDGSFHKLTVKVNCKDAQVVTRDGYFALADPAPSAELLSTTLVDAARARIEATGIRFNVHVEPPAPTPDDAATGASAGGGANATSGKRQMKLTLTLDPSEFALRPAAEANGALVDTVAIAFVAFDAKNQMLERAGVSLPFKLDPAQYDRAVKQGVRYTRTVNVPTGASEIRVVVYDAGNSRVGSVRVPATQ
jgi:VWFA-related protein